MTQSESASSPHREDEESINPYSASQVADPGQAFQERPVQQPRQYGVRLQWADRRRLLRVVFPMRLYAVIGGLVGVWALQGILQSTYELWWLEGTRGVAGWSFGLRIAFVVVRGVLSLYICWLYWRLAEAMAQTAGGTSTSMNQWSHLQLRIAWLMLAVMAVAGLSQATEWLLIQYLLNRVEHPPH